LWKYVDKENYISKIISFVYIDCYRKKQRGDCSGLDFQRAASERAQYVHNDHHPDQLPPINTPRPAVRHHSLRHPSWTLHQLEREVLSHPDVNTNIYEVC
jgi:hypothetical protein